ncbi:unnamed protein product [Triticum turgidum subsp. durum]|uniref:AB hydrolase-1 domain-containing protein n=1 Tax=Triticum turgidum subsp. durum TaxID=4567 RepID=A0A9R0XMW0_TRITD|nr:unnamed protein product [Triticum turgidum subsp. durum]
MAGAVNGVEAAQAQGGAAAAAGEAAIRHRTVEANGIAMHVAESGPEDGPAVLFLHGFPELWYSWRHQMAHLSARGYRCVAPDLRGYGGTEAPADVASYTAFHVVGDAVALLDALGIRKGVRGGTRLGRHHRVVPLPLPPGPRDGARQHQRRLHAPRLHPRRRRRRQDHRLLQPSLRPDLLHLPLPEPGVAEKEFAPAHARHLMTRILSDRFSERAAGKEPKDGGGDDADAALPPWLTEADIDYFAAAFEKTGFTGAINYYRNMDRNWELAAPWADAKVTVPTKFIVGDGDLTYHYAGIQDYLHKGGLKADVPLLEELVVVPGAGHFIQQERAQEVSDHIYSFIAKF